MALLSGTVVKVSGVGPGLGRSIAVASALAIRVNSVVPGYIWAGSRLDVNSGEYRHRS
jgi:hypothetical protein